MEACVVACMHFVTPRGHLCNRRGHAAWRTVGSHGLGPLDIGVFGHDGFVLGAPWPYPSSFGPFARLRAGWLAIEARAYTRSPPTAALSAPFPDVSGSVTVIARLP